VKPTTPEDPGGGPGSPAVAIAAPRRHALAAWIVVLAISDLPEILWRAAAPEAPAGLVWAKVALLALFAALCLGVRGLRPLAPFAGVMLVFLLALRGAGALGATALWRDRFAGAEGSFTLSYLDLHLRDLGVALAVLAALFALVGDRRRFFFARGDLGAPVGPVRWLGIRAGERWSRFVWIFGGVAAVCVAGVALAALRFEAGDGAKLLRLLPAVVLLAATNAFAEEVYFRLSVLGTLTTVVGRGQAQAMNVVLFGLAHWLAGSPPGLVGALMTGFLAWLMGKCVLETRGIFGAWIVHLLPDLVIFATYALLWRGL
jgi:hypothetical protein